MSKTLAFTFVMLDALVCDADIDQLPWWEIPGLVLQRIKLTTVSFQMDASQ